MLTTAVFLLRQNQMFPVLSSLQRNLSTFYRLQQKQTDAPQLTTVQVVSERTVQPAIKVGFLTQVKTKFRSLSENATLSRSCVFMYESCADDIDITKLMNYFELPDTFQTWFLLVQLHVWMCMIRVASESKGKLMRTRLVNSMWSDVEMRLGKLTKISRSKKKQNLRDMYHQFTAASISYDEGYFGGDMMLASSVWRTVYTFQDVDPRLIEKMVLYIRKQISHLDSLDNEVVKYSGIITWLPLEQAISEAET